MLRPCWNRNDESTFRAALVERIKSCLSAWIGAPTSVYLHGRTTWEEKSWADARTLNEYDLSEKDFLFIYFAAPETGRQVVLSISSGSRSAVYNLSFPNLGIAADMNVVSDIMSTLYQEISAMKVRCIVAAGGELEIESSRQTVEDVIHSTRELGSLINFVCCAKENADQLIGFVTIDERRGGLVLRRAKSVLSFG
jgi:hypothetical protein